MTRPTAVTLPDLARVDREADTIPPGKEPAGWAEWDAMNLAWSRLGPAERKVLLSIATRLVGGTREYGPFAKRGRDWLVELQAELLDAAVYVTAETEGIE